MPQFNVNEDGTIDRTNGEKAASEKNFLLPDLSDVTPIKKGYQELCFYQYSCEEKKGIQLPAQQLETDPFINYTLYNSKNLISQDSPDLQSVSYRVKNATTLSHTLFVFSKSRKCSCT